MDELVRTAIAFVFGLIQLYVWNYLLVASASAQILWVAYVMASAIVLAICAHKGIMDLKACLIASVCFGAIASMLDAVVGGAFAGTPLLASIIDIGPKVGFSLIGGLIFWVSQFAFASRRKIFATTAGVLARRIFAGVIDINVIILIAALLTVTTAVLALGATVTMLAAIAIAIGYKAALESESQTLGKQVMQIGVRRMKSSEPVGIARALARNANIVLLFAAPLFGSPIIHAIYIVVLLDLVMFFTGRRIFDRIADTVVSENKTRQ